MIGPCPFRVAPRAAGGRLGAEPLPRAAWGAGGTGEAGRGVRVLAARRPVESADGACDERCGTERVGSRSGDRAPEHGKIGRFRSLRTEPARNRKPWGTGLDSPPARGAGHGRGPSRDDGRPARPEGRTRPERAASCAGRAMRAPSSRHVPRVGALPCRSPANGRGAGPRHRAEDTPRRLLREARAGASYAPSPPSPCCAPPGSGALPRAMAPRTPRPTGW